MTRTALVPLATYPEAPSAECLDAVAGLAARLGCGLHALPLVVHFPKVANALSSLLLDVPEMARQAELKSRRAAEALADAMRDKATAAGVALATTSRSAGPELTGDVAAEEARYFDLSIIPAPAGNETCRVVAEAVVFGSGRPAVILPARPTVADPRRVVIAWDGSRVAARAAADALALLGDTAEVTIVSVLNEKPLPADDLGDRLAARLVERGIRASAEPVELEDQPIGATLQDFALRKGAGLLVMGAYGHSRLRDFVLGGATRTILEDVRLPVLMSH
jgi:nucleotide-binding universal stress UspA family protein